MAGQAPAAAGGLVWVEPLDQPAAKDAAGALRTAALAGDRGKDASTGGDQPVAPAAPPKPRPYYTINDQATLTNATAFTALIGRVPISGQVRDPMPIKVITGADNLATNGLEIPEVAGAVWGGRAIGDWTLGCVRGDLDVVTFIFEDGTIVTHRNAAGEPLAYLWDAFGNPCVAGERVTNAAQYLGSRVALTTAAAAADAAAASETTNVVSGAVGTTTSAVTGDRGRYVLGKSVSSGVEEVSRWLDARMQDSFDAIYVPPGGLVTVNVSRELPIDYDPTARRLRHAGRLDPTHRRALD
jgi:integrating conjugative element protein (TIGR03752 family)